MLDKRNSRKVAVELVLNMLREGREIRAGM